MNDKKSVIRFENEKSTGLHRCDTSKLINVNNWKGDGDRLFQINNLHKVDRYTTLEEAFNNGNIEYVYKHVLDDLNISTSSELEKITENGNTGWRLKGRDPNNHGDIGNGAIDFSYSDTSSTTYGSTGNYSFTEGAYTTASGYISHAEGLRTIAHGFSAHTEGYKTTASGDISHAEGFSTTASGYSAHTEGHFTEASGHSAHTEGYKAIASGYSAHAEGLYTKAQNTASHAEGKFNVGTSTNTIHETGIGTSDTDRKNAFEIYTDGTLTAPECTNTLIDSRGVKALVTKEYVEANSGELEKITENGNTGWRLKGRDQNNYGDIGNGAIDFSYSNYSSTTYGSTGDYSFAEGYKTTASGYSSHAEGIATTASGDYGSHAEGNDTTASGYISHAEGDHTEASGYSSHAEGGATTASGNYGSHAEGYYTTASGNYGSHAEGYYTIANNDSSHAEGKYNVGTSLDTIHETGIGTSNTDRKNAFEIYIDGTLTAPECTNTLIDSRGAKALVTKEYVEANGSELEKITENGNTGWRLKGRDPNNYGNIGKEAIDFSYSNTSSTIYGSTGDYSYAEGFHTMARSHSSHAEGLRTIAHGYSAHAEGLRTQASGNYGSHAEGRSTEASGDIAHVEGAYTTASGYISHAEGLRTIAHGYSAHAEGAYTTASGNFSHTEGNHTEASGHSAHAEGYYTIAGSHISHAEGNNTEVTGYSAHAEGYYTKAQNTASHAEGKYNVGTSLDTIHETGIGTSSTDRKNAFEIYIDGTLTAPECTNTLIDSRGVKALTTKEYVDNKVGEYNVIEETSLTAYLPDFNAMYKYFEYTLTQDATINNALNVSKGQYGFIVIKEDNIGGWNITWDTNYILSSGSNTLNTNPNAYNVFKYLVLDTDKILIDLISNFN